MTSGEKKSKGDDPVDLSIADQVAALSQMKEQNKVARQSQSSVLRCNLSSASPRRAHGPFPGMDHFPLGGGGGLALGPLAGGEGQGGLSSGEASDSLSKYGQQYSDVCEITHAFRAIK